MTVETKMSEYGVLVDLDIAGAPSGKLLGKTFVVKDLFDVKGEKTGGGNPDWLKKQPPAVANAKAIDLLLQEGASLRGKSCTDELALSLDGINSFYGIPKNPQLPECIPGGSSSGSASAVAGGVVDFSLGSDTVGSVRVPASYCGIYGFRPTHGAVPIDGVMPLGPSFDTVGWFARDGKLLADVGDVLLSRASKPVSDDIHAACLARNLFELIPQELKEPFLKASKKIFQLVSKTSETDICEYTLDTCAAIFGLLRSPEAWGIYRDWVEQDKPDLSPAVMQRLKDGEHFSAEEETMGRKLKADVTGFIEQLIDKHGVIILPTAYGYPPLKTASDEELTLNRKKNIRFTSISAVCGLPQISIPIVIKPGLKLGISIMGSRNSDISLLKMARSIEEIEVH